MAEDDEAENITCAACGEEGTSYVDIGFDGGDVCEHCADIITEEYSL